LKATGKIRDLFQKPPQVVGLPDRYPPGDKQDCQNNKDYLDPEEINRTVDVFQRHCKSYKSRVRTVSYCFAGNVQEVIVESVAVTIVIPVPKPAACWISVRFA